MSGREPDDVLDLFTDPGPSDDDLRAQLLRYREALEDMLGWQSLAPQEVVERARAVLKGDD